MFNATALTASLQKILGSNPYITLTSTATPRPAPIAVQHGEISRQDQSSNEDHQHPASRRPYTSGRTCEIQHRKQQNATLAWTECSTDLPQHATWGSTRSPHGRRQILAAHILAETVRQCDLDDLHRLQALVEARRSVGLQKSAKKMMFDHWL